jgi:hypothetical protein
MGSLIVVILGFYNSRLKPGSVIGTRKLTEVARTMIESDPMISRHGASQRDTVCLLFCYFCAVVSFLGCSLIACSTWTNIVVSKSWLSPMSCSFDPHLGSELGPVSVHLSSDTCKKDEEKVGAYAAWLSLLEQRHTW